MKAQLAEKQKPILRENQMFVRKAREKRGYNLLKHYLSKHAKLRKAMGNFRKLKYLPINFGNFLWTFT